MSIEGKPVNLLEQFVGETLTTFIPGSWGIYQPCTVHTRRGAFVPDIEIFHPEAK